MPTRPSTGSWTQQSPSLSFLLSSRRLCDYCHILGCYVLVTVLTRCVYVLVSWLGGWMVNKRNWEKVLNGFPQMLVEEWHMGQAKIQWSLIHWILLQMCTKGQLQSFFSLSWKLWVLAEICAVCTSFMYVHFFFDCLSVGLLKKHRYGKMDRSRIFFSLSLTW